MIASGRAPTAAEVAEGLGHRLGAAAARIGDAVARGAVGGQRNAAIGAVDPDHRGIAARPLHGIRHHRVVVLLDDPASGREIRAAEQSSQRARVIQGRLDVASRNGQRRDRLEPGALIDRRGPAHRRDRHPRHLVAGKAQHHRVGLDHPSDGGTVEAPLGEDRARSGLGALAQDQEHPLLTLREHDLVGRHAGLARGHAVEIELDPDAAPRRHLERRRGQPRRAHVLNRHDRVGLHQLEAGLEQQLLGEGVADLHGRAPGLGLLGEFGGRHGRAVDAVAAGLGPDVDHRIAGPGGARVEDLVLGRQADAHRVDQDVAVVGAMKGRFAADRGHADAVAVTTDAGDHAVDQMPGLGVLGLAEAQRVEERHGPGAHGEDVAQDAADPGRRPLIGLDVARVIVALDLEHRRHVAADVDHAGILARPADHPGRLGRQALEPALGRLVGAVLAPHDREDAELDQVRRAPENRSGPVVLRLGQTVLGDHLGGDLGHSSLGRPLRQKPRPAPAAGAGRRCRRGAGRRRARGGA